MCIVKRYSSDLKRGMACPHLFRGMWRVPNRPPGNKEETSLPPDAALEANCRVVSGIRSSTVRYVGMSQLKGKFALVHND